MSERRKPGRIAKKYSQAARLHDLIRILESRYGATVEELVEECQVTRRTIYRDLQAVEEAGYPLISERQSDGQVLYKFITGYGKIPPITFSLEELMTLYLCRGQLLLSDFMMIWKRFLPASAPACRHGALLIWSGWLKHQRPGFSGSRIILASISC